MTYTPLHTKTTNAALFVGANRPSKPSSSTGPNLTQVTPSNALIALLAHAGLTQKSLASFQRKFRNLNIAATALNILIPAQTLSPLAAHAALQGSLISGPARSVRGGNAFSFANFRSKVADTDPTRSPPLSPAGQDGARVASRTGLRRSRAGRVGRIMRRLSTDGWGLRPKTNPEAADLSAQPNRTHAFKMESLGVLTSGVAHDFNNIIGVINSALDQLESSDAKERDLQVARHATKRAAQIVRKLLAFARQEEKRICEIDHVTEVKDLISILTPAFGSAYRLSSLSSTEKWIKADPDLFGATIMNLAINARDAMAKGGDIEILARDATPEEQARAGGRAAGPMIAITITDDGEGISPETAKRVFEPFFSTKPAGKGTGLGLSMAAEFANEAGGTIFFDPDYRNGARVVLLLPAIGQPVAEQPAQISAKTVTLEGKRILVADDEGALCMMIERHLTSKGAIVSRASNVTKALDILDEKQGFDVVLVDQNMPDGSGLDVIKAAENGTSKGAIFLMISGDFAAVKATQNEGEPSLYQIPKPFRLNELSKAIATIYENPSNAEQIINNYEN